MIEEFKKQLEYKEGTLYWKTGPKKGKLAGCLHNDNYWRVRISGKLVLSHRIIFALHKGYLPDLVDHKDRNSLNNKINNLRESNKSLNAFNTDAPKNNTSGHKGVSKSITSGKWVAQIKTKKVKIHLGTFDTFEEAVAKRKEAEKQHIYDI